MRAVLIDRWMPPADVAVTTVPEPQIRAGTVLIRVQAAACNFADTLMVQGKYQDKPDFPFVPGGEVAGVVERVGEDAGHREPSGGIVTFKPGDRVMAYLGHGGFAERVVAPVERVHAVPEAMDLTDAAAFPIVYGTAYAAVVLRGSLRPGENLLVTAASGGVGLATIQVAKALGGRVIALTRADKAAAARKAGAAEVVDYEREDWIDRVRGLTAGRGADVIVENVGGDIFDGCTRCLAWGGRLVVSGFASGRIPEVRVNRVMLKHIAIVGLHFGPMHQHEPDSVRRMYEHLFRLYEAGKVAPSVSKVYPLEEAARALDALAAGQTVGKVVLRP